MALAGYQVPILQPDGAFVDSNPGSLNQWLKQHGGYDSQNDLIEETIPLVDPSRVNFVGYWRQNQPLSASQLQTMLDLGVIVIGNVHQGRHFVLITGYSADLTTFTVNDPGFDTLSYQYTDFVGFRVFSITD